MLKTRLSAVLSLLLVFGSGALLGVLAHRAYTMKTATASGNVPVLRKMPGEWRKHVVPVMRDRLKLDDQQTAQLNVILDEIDTEFGQVRTKWHAENQAIQKRLVDRINAMLRPDQQGLYEKWRAERESERQRRRGMKEKEEK